MKRITNPQVRTLFVSLDRADAIIEGAASLSRLARILRPGRFCGERVRVAFSVVRQSLWPAPSEPVGKRRRSQPKPSCAILRGKQTAFSGTPSSTESMSESPTIPTDPHFLLPQPCFWIASGLPTTLPRPRNPRKSRRLPFVRAHSLRSAEMRCATSRFDRR